MILVAIGVFSAFARVVAITGVATSVTEWRLATTRTLFPGVYAKEMPDIERSLSRHAMTMIVHVTTGAVFLTLGLLQFSPRIRARHLRFHRWSGRVLVSVALLTGLTGLWVGIVVPYSPTERMPIAAMGTLFLVAPAVAIRAVRRGDVVRHREWMIRFYATGVGIVVVRLVAPLIIWAMAPAPFHDIVGWTFWTGWIVSVTAGELWIRRTRGGYIEPSAAVARA
ncbi:MAG: DUF2306 domain-containing protein [Thermoanaerobaculia bacterium]